MKHKLIKLLIAIISPTLVIAQFNPGLPAGFGIDGDVLSGQSQNTNGTTSSLNSFDWFKKAGAGANVGYGIIDTTGAYANGLLIAQGKNVTINRGMAYSRYSTVNGYLLLDARYVRDHYGLSIPQDNLNLYTDKTVFTGSKNGDDPTLWKSIPTGGTITDKADIIDAYVHMRRDGTIINNTNPSALILTMGISTLANTGNRFIDFELYRSRINYNSSTGNFENSGSSATGGHTVWKFNSDGSVNDIGDMSVAFSFGTSGINELAVYIWISQADYNTVKPKTFNLVPNEYYGGTYGYAKIAPTATSPFRTWGSVSSSNTTGPTWGTYVKSLGGSSTNFYSNSYGVNDFAEAALDLTSLGIDPALSIGMDPCTPPYTRVMAKTRSSASYTSALQDFVGPSEFLDAPQAPAQIATPQVLQCKTTSITLTPATVVTGALYNWNTTNGNIIGSTTGTSITVDKPGKYYLSAAIVAGCAINLDSVTVLQDINKPIASVYVGGKIDINNPSSTVTLNGGDVNLSNFATPFGGSVGLTWKWTGPNGFTSNSRNNNVNKLGTYTLELTEERNGCKDTAYDVVEPLNMVVLPIRLGDFSAIKQDNNKVAVQWQDFDQTPHTLELQRSFNGMNFITIYTTKNNNNTLLQNYRDDISSRTGEKIFYKLKSTSLSGDVAYSKIIYLNYTDNGNSDLIVFPTVVKSFTNLVISCEQSTNANIQFLDLAGKMILQTNVSVNKGRNHLVISDLDKLKSGMYLVKVIVDSTIQSKKIIKE